MADATPDLIASDLAPLVIGVGRESDAAGVGEPPRGLWRERVVAFQQTVLLELDKRAGPMRSRSTSTRAAIASVRRGSPNRSMTTSSQLG